MILYISTPELLKLRGKDFDRRNKKDFPEPVIKAHGRSSSRYGIKAVDAWERDNGLLESLEIQPLISKRS